MRAFVDDDVSPGPLLDAADSLYTELATITELDQGGEGSTEIYLAYGKAISPLDAARCLLDIGRTKKFVDGLRTVVAERLRLTPGRPVHVLYAGCGPFATLALPLTTVFRPDELQLTLVDISDVSIRSAQRVVEALGLGSYVRAFHREDATTWRVPLEADINVVLVETMQRALTREPQVAIAWNLLAQLPDDVVLVPESILLSACLADIGAEVAPEVDGFDRVELGTVFELSSDAVRSWGPRPADGRSILPAGRVRLPRAPSSGEALVITTHIRVHNDSELLDYDSGITWPHPVEDPPLLHPGRTITFEYDVLLPGMVSRLEPEGVPTR